MPEKIIRDRTVELARSRIDRMGIAPPILEDDPPEASLELFECFAGLEASLVAEAEDLGKTWLKELLEAAADRTTPTPSQTSFISRRKRNARTRMRTAGCYACNLSNLC